MASTTVATFDPALKQIYRKSNLENLSYKKRPLLGLCPKYEGFGGRNMPLPIIYGNPQGRSAQFAAAQSNATPVLMEDFLLTRASNYAVATIQGEVIEATRGDNMAFLSALKLKIDSAMAVLSDDLETALFRATDGWRGRLHATTAPTVATPMVLVLDQIEEIPNFEVGMSLVADPAAAGGGTLRAAPAVAAIAGMSRALGTITTDFANAGAGTDWAVSDYLFVQGDPSAKISGLASWFPAAAPGAGAFFGVNRTVDDRLSGLIHNGATQPIVEAFLDASSKIAREQGQADIGIVHHAQYRKIQKQLEGKKEYTQVQAKGAGGMTANVFYEGVKIMGDAGVITLLAANKCQATTGWLLSMEANQYPTLGPPVKMLMEDGNRILRQAFDDGYEVRLGSRGQFGSKAPIWNANIALANP